MNLKLVLILIINFLSISSSFGEKLVPEVGDVGFYLSKEINATNHLYPGILAETTMDFSTKNSGAVFALYGIANGLGDIGDTGVHDIVGVHGTAYKAFNGWAAGVHADVYDLKAGGTSIGVNIEFPKALRGTNTVGLNIQPFKGSVDVIGVQLQHPETYKYGIKAPNTKWIFGEKDGVFFGLVFNEENQSLDFIRFNETETIIVKSIDLTVK